MLLLGAHCDDIEIGCGGTLLRMAPTLSETIVHWVVFSSTKEREDEAHRAAKAFAGSAALLDVRVHRFQNGYFPAQRSVIKDLFESLKFELDPQVIFCHQKEDLHQDHRLIGELCWNTFRDHLIMEYEIPKYDGDLGNPNVFVPIDSSICEEKARLILKHFPSQRDKQWFSNDTFHALARLRGIQAACPLAEAFYCRKLQLDFGAPSALHGHSCLT
ncbi:MAG: PIG-L family deacetylase [Roseibium album]|uniref:PIG-L deacetylase family protein n=1 Tax=Roseibium album TaxID=311410 RepID=UPI0032F04D6A